MTQKPKDIDIPNPTTTPPKKVPYFQLKRPKAYFQLNTKTTIPQPNQQQWIQQGLANPGTCVVTPLDDDYLQQGCVIGGASSFHAAKLFSGVERHMECQEKGGFGVRRRCVPHRWQDFVLNLQKGANFTPLQMGLKYQI